jgi:leucyl aminopeptidase (aminopeptidase T)
MKIRPKEHVLIVTDKDRYEIGQSIYQAARRITPYAELHVLKDSEKPIYELPKEIAEAVECSNASFWVASEKHPYELEDAFVDLAMRNPQRRHAHMSGITKQIMKEAMCVDYNEVEKFTNRVYDSVLGSREIKIQSESSSKKRTNLSLEINPKWKWVKSPGIIRRGEWDNLPGGELCTTPYKANGTVLTDLIGDYFDGKYGILNPPVYFEIEGSRILLDTLECGRNLNKELPSYLKTDENSDRASEVGLPTNFRLMPKPKIGNILRDEKARLHIGFGDTPDERIGADWSSRKHMDCILEGCNLSVDDKPLMKNGRYLFDFS